jgi:Myb-like DNA-binding domain
MKRAASPESDLAPEQAEAGTSKPRQRKRADIKDGHAVVAPWTPEQDATLLEVHKSLGNDWASIAVFLPGRTCVQVTLSACIYKLSCEESSVCSLCFKLLYRLHAAS